MDDGVLTIDDNDNNKKRHGRRRKHHRKRSHHLHLKMILIFLIGIISVIRLLRQHLPGGLGRGVFDITATTTTPTTTLLVPNTKEKNPTTTKTKLNYTAMKRTESKREGRSTSFNPRMGSTSLSSSNNNEHKSLQKQKHQHNIIIPEVFKKPIFTTVGTDDEGSITTNGQRQHHHEINNRRKYSYYHYYNEPIRNWGCSRTETPLIFVHIGKCGGGSIRARLAASAQNVTTRLFFDFDDFDIDDSTINNSILNVNNAKRRTNNNKIKNKNQWWKKLDNDNHYYYPISSNERGYYCYSKYKHHRMIPNSTIYKKSMEGMLPCFAKTPISMALACPETTATTTTTSVTTTTHHRRRDSGTDINNNNNNSKGCRGCQDLQSEYCHTIYAGHNALGSELHWLPPKYLHNWWSDYNSNNNSIKSNVDDASSSLSSSFLQKIIQEGFQKLIEPNDIRGWCNNNINQRDHRKQQSRPLDIVTTMDIADYDDVNNHDSHNMYSQCSMNLSSKYDSIFEQYWQIRQQQEQQTSSANTNANNTKSTIVDYSSLYASLPLHRITMLREPFAWLLSKFYWHKTHHLGYKCDDDIKGNVGWIQLYCLDYLIKICGDDCANRLDYALKKHGMSRIDEDFSSSSLSLLLEQFEQQAANNLRRSFSVVGILNETETFYDMVTKRINYIDMSLNRQIVGDMHTSIQIPSEETERCQKLYQESKFQNLLKDTIPIVATIDRLYKFGMKVNRHQMMELETCSIDD